MYRNEKVAPLIDALNELGMPMMAATLDGLYRSKNFLEMDHLSLLTAMIEPEYSAHTTKKLNNRLKRAGLISFPGQISDCMDSGEREYFPTGITESLGEMSFIRDGMNICILGPSDSGKSYLAKSLGIEACHDYRVAYHHCESLLEELVSLKGRDYGKYQRKIKFLVKLDLPRHQLRHLVDLRTLRIKVVGDGYLFSWRWIWKKLHSKKFKSKIC